MRKCAQFMLRYCFLSSICFLLLFVQTYGQSVVEKYEASEDTITVEELSNLRQLLPEHADSVVTILINNYDKINASADESFKNRTNYLLGISYYFKGMYLVSNYYYDKVLITAKNNKEDNSQLIEAVYNNKGVNFELLGHYESSIKIYLESLKIARSREDTLGIGQTTLNLGILFHQLQDTTKAIEYTREALDYFYQVNDVYHIALGNMNYGSFIHQDAPEKSNKLLKSALEDFIELDDSYRIAETMSHQANLFHSDQRYEEAVEKALLSLDYNPVDQFINLRIITYNILIDSYYQMNESENALPLIQEIHQAIEMNKIQSVKALEYFWPIAENVLILPENNEYRDYHLALKREFIANMERTRNSNIVAQFDILSNLEEGYADSLKQQLGEIKEDKNKFALLFLWAVTMGGIGWIGYLFRGYLPLPGQDFRTDYLIHKIKSLIVDLKDEKPDLSNDELSKSAYRDEEERENLTDSVSILFPLIDGLMMEEQLFKNPILSRSYLAKRLHTNTKYISMAVKKETGLSFKDYVNSCAISLAIAKIKQRRRNYTNLELAEICGYSNEATFYRNFKKLTGLTPNQFKDKFHHEIAH